MHPSFEMTSMSHFGAGMLGALKCLWANIAGERFAMLEQVVYNAVQNGLSPRAVRRK